MWVDDTCEYVLKGWIFGDEGHRFVRDDIQLYVSSFAWDMMMLWILDWFDQWDDQLSCEYPHYITGMDCPRVSIV